MTNKTRLVSGRVPVSNSTSVSSERYSFLDLSSAEPNLGAANADGYVLTFDSTQPGQRRWIPSGDISGSVGIAAFDKANSANVLAQAAFDYANTILSLDSNIDTLARTIANTATNNITILQGVDTTQNTNITNADTKAQAAFDKANTGPLTTTSATAPSSPTIGDMWYDTDTDVMLRYINDGTSNNWIDITGPIFRSTYIRPTYLISANVS